MPIAWPPKYLVMSDCRCQAVSNVLAMRLSSATSSQASMALAWVSTTNWRLRSRSAKALMQCFNTLSSGNASRGRFPARFHPLVSQASPVPPGLPEEPSRLSWRAPRQSGRQQVKAQILRLKDGRSIELIL